MRPCRVGAGRRLVASAVLSVVAVFALTAPAAAHSELAGSVPAQDAVVTAPLDNVR